MTLSALNHRKLPTVAVGSMTGSQQTSAVLDAIYTALTTGSYYNGTSRSAGTGSAVKNVTRYQTSGATEAVYGEFAGSNMSGVKFIFSGQDNATKSPTFRTPDTTLSGSQILVGLTRNAGAFNAWDNANPFTSGQSFGFWKCGLAYSATPGVQIANVEMYESQDTLWFTGKGTGDSNIYACAVGALWDPDSTSVNASELNGRRIGIITTGNTIITNNAPAGFIYGTSFANWTSQNQPFMFHSTNAGVAHAGTLTVPSGSSVTTLMPDSIPRPQSDSNYQQSSGQLDDGKIVRRMFGLHVAASAATAAHSANVVGRLREVSTNPLIRHGSTFQSGSQDVAYAISTTFVSVGPGILLHF